GPPTRRSKRREHLPPVRRLRRRARRRPGRAGGPRRAHRDPLSRADPPPGGLRIARLWSGDPPAHRACVRARPQHAALSRNDPRAGGVRGGDVGVGGGPGFEAMTHEELLRLISIDPNICFGRPYIKGNRIWVSLILDLLAAGATVEEIIADYPQLTRDDVVACIAYGSEMSRERYVDIPVTRTA